MRTSQLFLLLAIIAASIHQGWGEIIYVTHSGDSGPGSFRKAVAGYHDPADGTTDIIINSSVTDVFLTSPINAGFFDTVTIKTKGQTCTIKGDTVNMLAYKGWPITLENLSFTKTTFVYACNDFKAT